MNGWLLGIVSLIYLATAAGYWRDGRTGMALAFTAYALSNIGFILDVWRK